jgi:hypothetical protein
MKVQKLSRLGSLLVAVIVLGFVGPSDAALRSLDGTLSLTIGQLGGPSLTGSGQGVSDGAFGLATVPAGLMGATGTVSVPITPPVLNLGKITVMGPVANLAGSFNPGGVMGHNIVANLFFTGGTAAGSVPLAYVGGGGTGMALMSGLPLTILGAGWTNLGASAGDPTKTIMITQTAAGIPITLTATAFDQRTAGGQGTLQLVAPALVKLFGGSLGNLPVVGVLTLEYGAAVPEPSLLLLLGSGVVGLLALGRARRRV